MSPIFTAKSLRNPSNNPKMLNIVVFRHLTTKIRQIESGKLLIFHLYWTLRRTFIEVIEENFENLLIPEENFESLVVLLSVLGKFSLIYLYFLMYLRIFCDFTCTWAENDSFCCTCTFVLTWKFHDLSTCTYVPDFDQVHVLGWICTCTFEVYTLLLYAEWGWL